MKNNIKLFLFSGLAAATLVLQGCGGSDTEKAPTPTGPDAYEVGSHPRFDPVISDIPFNTDIIFSVPKGVEPDGTANVGAATDPVRAALNRLDGFSTSAYFDILIDGSVDPATAIPLQTVFLVEVQSNGDALDPANIVGLVGPASFDVRVVSLDGGTNNAIRLRPTEPLKAKTKYLVFLTNDIEDMSGEPLTRSWSYNSLRDPAYETLSALLPVRTAITGWETLASGFLQFVTEGALDDTAAKSKLILTYTFTTTDPLAPLMAMGAPRAAIVGAQVVAGVPSETAVTAASGLEGGGYLSTPKARPLGVNSLTGVDFNTFNAQLAASVGKLYTGYIALPYYQTEYSGSFNYLQNNWQPDLVLADVLGQDLPTDIDGSYNVTYRYPFAAKQSDETIPLQVTMPESAFEPTYGEGANCGQIYAATGYPVVIYVHGITSDRTSVLALGHTLASQCVATVAIDLPLHGVAAYSSATGGSNPLVNVLNVEKSQLIPFADLYGNNTPHERHFNIAGAGGAPAAMNFDTPTARDGSGAQFINLGYLANTRDNNRQAVMDLLNLNASLGALSDNLEDSIGVGLNTNRVYVVGISLGGILGSIFATVNEASILNEQAANLSSNLNPIQGVVLSTAGTQVSQILVNSATFAPVINGGLAASGVNVGTSNYERFLYAAQSMLDSADPVNFMTTLSMLGVPVLIQQVNGDLVIPNSADSAPLAGTSAMASLLGADQLGLGSRGLGLGYVKMTAGDHVSLLRPTTAAPQVTAELQTQVATFVLTSGTVTVGAEASGDVEEPLDPCACMPPQ